MSKDMSQDIFI